jgi:hypothetical protein
VCNNIINEKLRKTYCVKIQLEKIMTVNIYCSFYSTPLYKANNIVVLVWVHRVTNVCIVQLLFIHKVVLIVHTQEQYISIRATVT